MSADEQTCSMQGKSQYKTCCGKYKKIGDEIQTNAIADDGYTFDFYFWNKPVPEKWISLGLLPMHARLLHMLENFKDLHHSFNMDSLFNSVNFTIAAATCTTKVRTQGVLCKSYCGVPPCVYQDELPAKPAERA